MKPPTSATGLVGLLAGAGILHFAVPGPYERLVPARLGHARGIVYVSGVAELAVAAVVAPPRTRRTGGLMAAALFVAVFPANVSMARDRTLSPRLHRAALLRLPLQAPLVGWALFVARAAGQSSR